MPGKPTSSYIICTTPRSGSWMLCFLLEQTRCAGRPSEYFGPSLGEEFTANHTRLRVASVDDYFDRLIAYSTTSNGVFGTKLIANMTPIFVRRAAEHQGRSFGSLRTALESEFPKIRYLLLTRENKVAQAISYYHGIMSGVWLRRVDSTGPIPPVEYDSYAIERCYQDIVASDAYWEEYFHAHGIEPFRLTYEALTADFEQEVRRILAYLRLPTDVPVGPPQTVKLADERSRSWEEEFRRTMKELDEPYFRPESYWAPY